MWRRFSPYLLVALPLAAFAGFAWLTRHPDAELLRRAEQWPLVGGAAGAFRRAYLPPPPAPRPEVAPAPGPAPPAPREKIARPGLELRSLHPVWVPAGTSMRAAPDAGAPEVARVEEIARLEVLSGEGEWLEVRYLGAEGWVLLEQVGDEPPLGSDPEPVLPLPGQPPDPDLLQVGHRLLGTGERALPLGPYRLFTDVEDGQLLALAARIASELEATYRRRYALAPVDRAREAVLLFGAESDYLAFRAAAGGPPGRRAEGHVDRGLVALNVGDRSRRQTLSILIHELAHLLNRRALGPALPPWLDEGLAEDLAASRIDESGRLHPEELGGEAVRVDQVMIHRGPPAAARLLLDRRAEGSAPALGRLLDMDQDEFLEGDRKLHYALSLFWVRYLLSDDDLPRRAGFLSFLLGVSRGEPTSGERLLQHLDEDWEDLEAGFWHWLAERAVEGPEPGSG